MVLHIFVSFSLCLSDFFVEIKLYFLDDGLRYEVFLFRLIGGFRYCHDPSKSLMLKSLQELSFSLIKLFHSFRIMLLLFKVLFILVQILVFLIPVCFTADSRNCL